jgi:hypothetical protein
VALILQLVQLLLFAPPAQVAQVLWQLPWIQFPLPSIENRVLQVQVKRVPLKTAAFLQVTHWLDWFPVQVAHEKWHAAQFPRVSL